MKLKYMKDGYGLCTEIDVDYMNETVKIKNYVDHPLDRAFGINENPTFKDYEAFLEDRCMPRTRQRLDLELKMLGLNCGYNPFVIAKHFNGRTAGDSHYIIFEEEGEFGKTN